jgi:hypothetical protein
MDIGWTKFEELLIAPQWDGNRAGSPIRGLK